MPRRKADLVVAPAEQLPAPWEPQKTETDEEFSFFVRYRDMAPPRLLKNVRGMATSKVLELFRKNLWAERVLAWDGYLDKVRCEEIEAAYRQNAKSIAVEHMHVLAVSRELLTRELEKYLEDSKQSAMSGLLSPGELTRMMETVIKYDRLVRDQSTENTAHAVRDLSKLSVEDLLEMERLQVKIEGGGNE